MLQIEYAGYYACNYLQYKIYVHILKELGVPSF